MVAAWNSWKATTAEAACAPQKRVGESWEEDPSVENISTHLKCTDACGCMCACDSAWAVVFLCV